MALTTVHPVFTLSYSGCRALNQSKGRKTRVGALHFRNSRKETSALFTKRLFKRAGISTRLRSQETTEVVEVSPAPLEEDEDLPPLIDPEIQEPPRRLVEGVDFTEQYTPSGYLYEVVPVTKNGKERLKGEPDWEYVRPKVGEVGKRRYDSFVIDKTLSADSQIIEVTLERPLGIVFEQDSEGRVRVSDLIQGMQAKQMADVARLNQKLSTVALEGDVLRAFTATILQYPFKASLVGDLTGTIRKVVLYGADDQPWTKTSEALRIGRKVDGPVTLVLERPSRGSEAEKWEPMPDEEEQQPQMQSNALNKQNLDPFTNDGKYDQDAQDIGTAVLAFLGVFVFLLIAGFF